MKRYTIKDLPEKSARARLLNVPVSIKDSINVCNFLKGMKLKEAEEYLESVIRKEKAIPYRRFLDSISHRPGMGPGRYPVKVSKYVLELLKNVEANAENKNLDVDKLIIYSILVKKGETIKKYMPRAYGRATPFFKERVHFEVIVKEVE
ncbi:MAG: 50S ribosomal protein L22 [Thermoplasmata archaeon]